MSLTAPGARLRRRLVSTLTLATLTLPALACTGFHSSAEAVDAGAEADAGDAFTGPTQATFCDRLAPPAVFCADFEREPFRDGWENAAGEPDPGTYGGGAIAVASLDPGVEPGRNLGARAAEFTTPALISSTKNAGAYLVRRLDPASKFILQFQLRFTNEQYGAHGRIEVLEVSFGPANATVGAVEFYRDDLATVGLVTFDGPTVRTPVYLTETIPTNAWREVRILVDNVPVDGGSDGLVSLAIDGVPAARTALPASVRGAPMFLALGAPVARGALEPARVQIDNVRVYSEP